MQASRQTAGCSCIGTGDTTLCLHVLGYKGDRGRGCLLIHHLWKFEVAFIVSREPCILSRNDTLFFPSSGRREIGPLYCPCCPPELLTTCKSKAQETPSQRHGTWLSSSLSELLLDGGLVGLSPHWLFPVNPSSKGEVTSEPTSYNI